MRIDVGPQALRLEMERFALHIATKSSTHYSSRRAASRTAGSRPSYRLYQVTTRLRMSQTAAPTSHFWAGIGQADRLRTRSSQRAVLALPGMASPATLPLRARA